MCTCAVNPFAPSRNVKPPKRYVGLKPHRRRSSGPLPAVLFFSPSLCILYPNPLPRPPLPHRLLPFPHRFVYTRYMATDAGSALTALMHSANIASANGSLFTLRILSLLCVRACVRRVRVGRSKTRRRRRKSRCRAESTRLMYLCRKPSNLLLRFRLSLRLYNFYSLFFFFFFLNCI